MGRQSRVNYGRSRGNDGKGSREMRRGEVMGNAEWEGKVVKMKGASVGEGKAIMGVSR